MLRDVRSGTASPMAHLLDLNYLLARIHSVHFTVGLVLFAFFSYFPRLNECLLFPFGEIVPVDPFFLFYLSIVFFFLFLVTIGYISLVVYYM